VTEKSEIRLTFPLPPDDLVVLGMGSYPKPDYFVVVYDAQRSIMNRDANGINGACRMHTFEMEGGIIWVFC